MAGGLVKRASREEVAAVVLVVAVLLLWAIWPLTIRPGDGGLAHYP